MTVYLGSIGQFKSWKKWDDDEKDRYSSAEEKTVKNVESLLIYAHQPVYTKQNKESAYKAFGIRIFITGRIGQLFPEISYLYFVDDV